MRLLYVIDSLAPGGAETSLAEMAPGLIAAGIELHVLALRSRLDLAERLEQAGAVVNSRVVHTGRMGNVKAVVDLARQIRPDLLHTTLFEADIAGRTAARLMRLPASTSLVTDSYGPAHYAETNRRKLHAAQALDAATARFASRFHAVSAHVAQSVGPRLGVTSERIDIVSRGRDPRRLPFLSTALRHNARLSLAIPHGRPLILAVGRHEPAKGLIHLLNALQLVADQHPDAIVVLAGREGHATPELLVRAQQVPLEVRFLGHRTDVPHLLAAADVLCFPSEREGSPGTLIEAMAIGCPVVASSIPPVLEVIGLDDECAAILTPAGDSIRIGQSLNHILSAEDDLDVQLARGRARFERLYSIDSVAKRMADFFQRAAYDTPSSPKN